MCNEVKRMQFERLRRWLCWWGLFTKYTIEMTSDGMVHIPSFTMTGYDIQVVLKLFSQESESPQCCFYWSEGLMKYVGEIGSGAISIDIPTFRKIDSDIHKLVRKIHMQTHGRTESRLAS
jgi:hypothetical protein